MGRTKRDTLKRQAAQIYLGLERVLENTNNLKTTFDEHHPELGAALEVIMVGCFESQELLSRFWTEAWGQENPRWESWI